MSAPAVSEFALPFRIDGARLLPFLASLHEAGLADEIILDFTGLRRVSPASLAVLVATVVRWRREKRV